MNIGDRVRDAQIVRVYGVQNARVGTVTRIYSAPVGMVEVRWDIDPADVDDCLLEDIWSEDLVTA